MNLETLLSPAELPALAQRDLRGAACVVFDILRATSTFVTALHHGASAIVPVGEIAQAVARRRQQPDVRLAGERNGVRIGAERSGGVDFDFGNSPREFTPARVSGTTIVATTTNGTRAFQACAQGEMVLAGSFLNLAATADYLRGQEKIILICAGTGESVALEDVLAAGALCDLLAACRDTHPTLSDSSIIARQTYTQLKAGLPAAIASSQNGRRLLTFPELQADVAFCAQRDIFSFVVRLDANGQLRQV
jgi:2-phosphosulfolactate phosphatase